MSSSTANLPAILQIPGWKIIGFAFALRLLLLIALPTKVEYLPYTLSAYNDEPAHYNYVKYMAEHGCRPIQLYNINESRARGLNDYEYYQPPFFYRMAGYLYNSLPESLKSVYSVRGLNLLLGLMLILTVGKVLTLFKPDYAAAGMIFLAVLGSSVFFTVTVTNDVLLWLLCALMAYYGILLLKNPDFKKRLALTLCLTAAIWTKLSVLVLLPAIFYVLFISFKSDKTTLKLIYASLWLIFAYIWTVPLFYENHLYYGNILPMSVGLGEAHNIMESISLKRMLLVANYMTHSFWFPFENYWLGIVRTILFLVMGLLTLVILIFAGKSFRNIFKIASISDQRIYIFLGLSLAGAVAGLLMMIVRYHQSEPRLTFVALPALVLVFIAGLDKISGGRRRRCEQLALIFSAIPYILFLLH